MKWRHEIKRELDELSKQLAFPDYLLQRSLDFENPTDLEAVAIILGLPVEEAAPSIKKLAALHRAWQLAPSESDYVKRDNS